MILYPKNFTCIICKKLMSHSDTLAIHMKQHYPVINTLICPKCKKKMFNRKRTSVAHSRNSY